MKLNSARWQYFSDLLASKQQQLSMRISSLLMVCLLVGLSVSKLTPEQLNAQLQTFLKANDIMALDVEILDNDETVFKGTYGTRDYARKLPANNQTKYRMASLSKSMTAAGLMLLIKQGKVKLNETLTNIFGFLIENPFFPDVPLTVQMLLTHQSSYIEGPSYNSFLQDTYYKSKSGADIPNIYTLFTKGAKYYNASAFDRTHPPGTYYRYANLNYLLVGTIIEKIAKQRFDIFMSERFFKEFTEDMTFNPVTLSDANNLAVLYEGDNGKWVPTKDNYNGSIPDFDMTGYVLGTNAGYYGPQGSVRASVTDLVQYINIIRKNGLYKDKSILPADMVLQMKKPKYQYHGKEGGGINQFHAYGYGLFRTTYRTDDNIWKHKVVVGHVGDAYGLASAYFYYGNYSVAYVMSGILNGYTESKNSHFTVERQKIHNLTEAFLFQ